MAPTSHSGWTSSKRPQLPQRVQRSPGPRASPVPTDSAGRLAQTWGSQDRAGHWGTGARLPSRVPLTASSRSCSAASMRAEQAWALGVATMQEMEAGFLSSPAPDSSGLPSWPIRVGPDEESSVNSAHPAKQVSGCLSGGRNSSLSQALLWWVKLFRRRAWGHYTQVQVLPQAPGPVCPQFLHFPE